MLRYRSCTYVMLAHFALGGRHFVENALASFDGKWQSCTSWNGVITYAYTWLKPTVPRGARTRSASLLFRSDMHETECGADHTQLQEQKTNLRFALSPSVFMVLSGSSTPIRTMNMQYILPRWTFLAPSNSPVVHFPTDIERDI